MSDDGRDDALFDELLAIVHEYGREHRVLLDRSAPAIRAMDKLEALVQAHAADTLDRSE